MSDRCKRGILTCTVALSAALVVILVTRTHWLNGPWYWKWHERHLPAIRTYAAFAIAGLPVMLGAWLVGRERQHPAIVLVLFMLGSFALRLATVFIQTEPMSLSLVPALVQSPGTTSYYTDAVALSRSEWSLAEYPQIMPLLNLHSQSKPPGPVMYYYGFVKLFGPGERTALTAGIALGLLATVSIPATWWMIRTLTGDQSAALLGSAFLSMCPGFVVFFPMMDPVYPVLSCALIGLWALAIRTGQVRYALLMGAALCAVLFVTFNVLVIGAFLLLLSIPISKNLVRQAAVTIGTCAMGCLLMWMLTGYDPIATFVSAWKNQHALLARYAHERPYPATILFDLYDFALGAGWIGLGLAVCALVNPAARRLVLMCFGQFILVAILGLLQSETARVWSFMLPLLMVPVGLVLRDLGTRARLIVLVSLLSLLAACVQTMVFVM